MTILCWFYQCNRPGTVKRKSVLKQKFGKVPNISYSFLYNYLCKKYILNTFSHLKIAITFLILLYSTWPTVFQEEKTHLLQAIFYFCTQKPWVRFMFWKTYLYKIILDIIFTSNLDIIFTSKMPDPPSPILLYRHISFFCPFWNL
jgi:hypothetical protein